MRLPKGRATERVVNDILMIAEGIDLRGPLPLGPPLTESTLVDMLEEPTIADASLQGATINEQIGQVPEQLENNPQEQLPGMVARGENLTQML